MAEKIKRKELLPYHEFVTPEKLREFIKQAVGKLGPNVSKEQKKEYGKLLVKIYEKGMTPREAMNVTDEQLMQIYSYAYHLFSTAKYEEARELFKMMLSLEPLNADFATALGVCHHRLKSYDDALTSYMLAAFLDEQNPVPLFYAYDCYTNLKEDIPACIMLSNVVARAGDRTAYAQVKKDAQMRLEQLQTKILEDQAAKTTKS